MNAEPSAQHLASVPHDTTKPPTATSSGPSLRNRLSLYYRQRPRMSAKLSVNPFLGKPVIPLPPEIYFSILKAALEVPFDFDLQLFRDVLSPGRFAERTLRARLVSSRHFMRVCRRWHDFVLPLFYETVWVSKMSQVEALIHRFQSRRESYVGINGEASTSESSPLISSFVKRLVFTPSMQRNLENHHPILQLASYCSSPLSSLHILTIISHRPTDSPDPNNGRSEQFIHDLSALRNLEVLNLSSIWPPPSLRTVWSAIEGMERLEVLRTEGLNWSSEYFIKLVEDTKLRKLSMTSPYSTYSTYNVRPTNLDEIAFLGTHETSSSFPTFSSNVERLALEKEDASSLASLLSSDWLDVHFPHTCRLDVFIHDWRELTNLRLFSILRVTLPGGLARVGFAVTRKLQGSRRDYLGLKDFCGAIAKGAPQVQEIQILHKQTCVDLARRHPMVLENIIDDLRPSQIVLLDSDGKAFLSL